MKNEFDNNLTEPFGKDDLGIRASMESIEPEAGARERMLQNIRKKAALVQAEEGIASGAAIETSGAEEASKAEILSLNGAAKAAEKKRKNRWKLYIPMIAAAALIVTVGTVFFAAVGIEKMGSSKNAARDDHPAYEREEDGKDVNAGGHDAQDGWDAVTDATRNAYPLKPDGNQTDAPDGPKENPAHFPGHTKDAAQTQVPQNDQTGSPDGPAELPSAEDPENQHSQKGTEKEPEMIDGEPRTSEWLYVNPVSEIPADMYVKTDLLAAIRGLDAAVVENSDALDTVLVSYEGHKYRLQYLENGQMEVPYDPGMEVAEAGENVTLWVRKKTGLVSFAEWSANGTKWYALWNLEDAPQENVLALIGKMQESCRNLGQ